MAPELMGHEPGAKRSKETDSYAFGCVCLEVSELDYLKRAPKRINIGIYIESAFS
jgi:hypothetical protein